MRHKVELRRPKDREMCPLFYHVVKGHRRVCEWHDNLG